MTKFLFITVETMKGSRGFLSDENTITRDFWHKAKKFLVKPEQVIEAKRICDSLNSTDDIRVAEIYIQDYNSIIGENHMVYSVFRNINFLDDIINKPIKINENQLRKLIREAIQEYRDGIDDGDHKYIRPNGESNVGTGLEYLQTNSNSGKRSKTQSRNDNGKLFQHNSPTQFSHGKGEICDRVSDVVEDMFFKNDKIEWTEREMKEIRKIRSAILHLATITKEEGNKKRGYLRDTAEE